MSRSMEITRLAMRETGSYNDIGARPYVSDISTDAMCKFDEATRGGTIFSTESLAGIAGTILRPKAEHEGLVQIDNGFPAPRFRFMMETEHKGAMGSGHRQVLVGYTDTLNADVTRSGNDVEIDPRMRFYINSVLTLREVNYETPGGIEAQKSVFDNSHILSGEYAPSVRRNEGNTPVRMRPEDVLANMAYVDRNLTGGMGDFGMSQLVDLRATFADGICKSRRSNSSSTSYLTSIMKAHKKAVDKASVSRGDRFSTIESARGIVQENMITDDLFLGSAVRETSLSKGSSITFGELLEIAPYLDEVTDISFVESMRRDSVMPHRRGETEMLTGADSKTVTALALAHSVPSIMMDLMIVRCNFSAHNRTRDGQIQVTPQGFRMFTQVPNPEPYLDTLLDRLEMEVLRDLTRFNRGDFDLDMSIDVFGETRITLSMDGSRPETFVVPSFADSLFVPVMGRDTDTLSGLASDLSQMTDMVQSALSNTSVSDAIRERDSGRGNYNNKGFGNYDTTRSAV